MFKAITVKHSSSNLDLIKNLYSKNILNIHSTYSLLHNSPIIDIHHINSSYQDYLIDKKLHSEFEILNYSDIKNNLNYLKFTLYGKEYFAISDLALLEDFHNFYNDSENNQAINTAKSSQINKIINILSDYSFHTNKTNLKKISLIFMNKKDIQNLIDYNFSHFNTKRALYAAEHLNDGIGARSVNYKFRLLSYGFISICGFVLFYPFYNSLHHLLFLVKAVFQYVVLIGNYFAQNISQNISQSSSDNISFNVLKHVSCGGKGGISYIMICFVIGICLFILFLFLYIKNIGNCAPFCVLSLILIIQNIS